MVITYDPVLVLLSIGVAIMGSLTALTLTLDGYQHGPWPRGFTLTNSGLIMGSTIWSMHFVAMMAASVPVPINYSMLETLASICIAMAATGTGLHLARTRLLKGWSIPVGGLLMGFGIAGMHYVGMAAIRGCGLAYNWPLVAASVAIAVGASMAALWFTFTGRGLLASVGGGVVQGLAIASMHYTAMAATFYVPLDVPVVLSMPLFSQSALAYLIASGMVIASASNLVLLVALSGNRSRSPA